MNFVALNSGGKKSTMIYLVIVKLPTWVIHGLVKTFLILILEIIITNNMVDMHPLSNKNRIVLNHGIIHTPI